MAQEQENVVNMIFKSSLDKEELLIKKYEEYFPEIKDKYLKDMLEDFRKEAREHIRLLKDKMIKLNIQ